MAKDLFPPQLYDSVREYKKKFFVNLLVRGIILFVSIVLGYFFFISLLEYFGWFGSAIRALFLFSFVGLTLFIAFIFVFRPLYSLWNADTIMSDEKAARELGKIFPQVKDKLLNVLQLWKLGDANSLAMASVRQKSDELINVPFGKAIDFGQNKKYARFLFPLILVIGFGAALFPGLITESPKRIASFNQIFPKPAPFTFRLLNRHLNAFRNEDFVLKFLIEGKEIPEIVRIIYNGQEHVLSSNERGEYSFTFPRLHDEISFQLEGAGFFSQEYDIRIINKPLIGDLNAQLHFPNYLGRKDEYLKNVGNLNVPEGTRIVWDINCLYTDQVRVEMSHESTPTILEAGLMNGFSFSTIANKSFQYKLKLVNDKAKADGDLEYTVNVAPDVMPKISVVPVKDSSLFNYILLGGTIEDDYGFSSLRVFYKVLRKSQVTKAVTYNFPIRFSKGNNYQNFYLNWLLDSLHLSSGDKLEYYVKVWDNDGVNGPKSVSSETYLLELPSERTIADELRSKKAETSQNLSNSHSQSKAISKQLDKLQNNLKNKKDLNWQDRKNLEELLQKQKELKERLEDLQKQNELINTKEEKFIHISENLIEKTQQLQELMKALLDDETLKLYQELQKLMEEKNNSSEIKDLLDKIENKQQRFDKELERMLEMFKQLKFEKELENAVQKIDQLSKDQDKLSQKTPNDNIDNQKIAQQNLNDKFEGLREDLKQLDQLNKSLEEKNGFDKEEAIQKSISEKQQNSLEQLGQGNKKGAQKQQKSAAEQMEDLKEQLQKAQQEMEAEVVDENIENLRFLLENLLTLSFEQETLMKEFKKINQTDPRYVGLLQRQMKLKDDAKMVEDTLYALSKRVFQVKKFVTKEVGEMNDYIKESIADLKMRHPDISAGKQQFAMTSMNNLALMLSEVLKQLQDESRQMKSKPGRGQCKKPGGKGKGRNISDLQRALNKKIGELKQSGKSGKEFSQDLAQLIAEQQAIRKMLMDMEGKGNLDQNGKQQLKELAKKMEETERDLAFKQLSSQTIIRQNDIVTRLLESEKALREREFEEKRESNVGKQDIDRKLPPALDKYLKEKEKQIEMLKSTPPSLNPYYKEKVGQYFQKISQ